MPLSSVQCILTKLPLFQYFYYCCTTHVVELIRIVSSYDVRRPVRSCAMFTHTGKRSISGWENTDVIHQNIVRRLAFGWGCGCISNSSWPCCCCDCVIDRRMIEWEAFLRYHSSTVGLSRKSRNRKLPVLLIIGPLDNDSAMCGRRDVRPLTKVTLK